MWQGVSAQVKWFACPVLSGMRGKEVKEDDSVEKVASYA
jgi:hypothetical protein